MVTPLGYGESGTARAIGLPHDHLVGGGAGERLRWVTKTVHVFLAWISEESTVLAGHGPRGVSLRWVTLAEISTVSLVSEELRPIIGKALTLVGQTGVVGRSSAPHE
jgi:hypothetical protein